MLESFPLQMDLRLAFGLVQNTDLVGEDTHADDTRGVEGGRDMDGHGPWEQILVHHGDMSTSSMCDNDCSQPDVLALKLFPHNTDDHGSGWVFVRQLRKRKRLHLEGYCHYFPTRWLASRLYRWKDDAVQGFGAGYSCAYRQQSARYRHRLVMHCVGEPLVLADCCDGSCCWDEVSCHPPHH